MFARKKAERTCPKGHVLEESWERCPHCEAERGSPDAAPAPVDADTEPDEGGPRATEPSDPARRTVVVSRPVPPEPRIPAGWLVVTRGERVGEDHRIEFGRNVLGKRADCDVVLREAHASERHAVLEVREGGKAWLEDLDSRHGTALNGTALRGRHELADGDRIRIGGTELRFRTFDVG